MRTRMVLVSVAPAGVSLNPAPAPHPAIGVQPADIRSDEPTDPLPRTAVASLLRTLPEPSGQADASATAGAEVGAEQPHPQGRLLRLIRIVGTADPSTGA